MDEVTLDLGVDVRDLELRSLWGSETSKLGVELQRCLRSTDTYPR
jgi:hypothetical protein